jgi:hypothetical protein
MTKEKRTGEFDTVEELVDRHREIFRKGCSVTTVGESFLPREKNFYYFFRACAERPIPENNFGVLAETTVRIPFDGFLPPKHYLRRAILLLQSSYGKVSFDIVITANLILRTGPDGKYDVWFGQDFSSATEASELRVGTVYRVRDLFDVKDVPGEFNLETFVEAARRKFPGSNVLVHSVINLVYIVRTFVAKAPLGTAVVKLNAFWDEEDDGDGGE